MKTLKNIIMGRRGEVNHEKADLYEQCGFLISVYGRCIYEIKRRTQAKAAFQIWNMKKHK